MSICDPVVMWAPLEVVEGKSCHGCGPRESQMLVNDGIGVEEA